MTVVDSPATADEVLRATQDLAPAVAARATEIEAARRLPPDLLDELVAAGCFRMLLPASHVGVGADLPTAMRVLETLAVADASVAWTVGIAGGAWLDLAEVNTAYWQGQTEVAIFERQVAVGGPIQFVPPTDMAELNAADWVAWAEGSDPLNTYVVDETGAGLHPVGAGSIKFVTNAAFMPFITPRPVATNILEDTIWTVGSNAVVGGPKESRILIPTGTNQGILQINIMFYNAPDQLRVYYEGNLERDTGLVGNPQQNFVPGDVDIPTDRIAIVGHGLTDGDAVAFRNFSTPNDSNLPGGILGRTKYFIVNSTANDFQLSLTPGGPVIDITTVGAGTHSLFEYATLFEPYGPGASDIIEIVVNEGTPGLGGTQWDYDFVLLDNLGVPRSVTFPNADQRFTAVAIRNGSLYAGGITDALATNGIISRLALPMQHAALPLYSLNWPNAQGGTRFNGVAASSNGVYAAGDSYTRTFDTPANDKQTKGITVKFPLAAPQFNLADIPGQIWDAQTPPVPPTPGGFDFAGTGLHYAALNGHRPMVEFLLAHGADRNIKDTKVSSTAAGWAEHGGHNDLLDLLR